MRIPTTKFDLTEAGYEGYWVVMPRTVKEGFVHDLGQLADSRTIKKSDDEGERALAEAERGRDVNIRFLELITEWNLDDDDGKILPLVRSAKDRKAKAEIVAEIPVEIIRLIAEKLGASAQASERVKGF